MEQKNTRLRNVGFITFFFSGICAISSGVVVSLLQEQYGFAYGMTGTLLSLMSIGNLLAGFLIAMLPGKLGWFPPWSSRPGSWAIWMSPVKIKPANENSARLSPDEAISARHAKASPR